jgi:hypothetical protein
MAINGASRLIQAEVELAKKSYSEINADFKNENEKLKATTKISLKYPSEHNHSK